MNNEAEVFIWRAFEDPQTFSLASAFKAFAEGVNKSEFTLKVQRFYFFFVVLGLFQRTVLVSDFWSTDVLKSDHCRDTHDSELWRIHLKPVRYWTIEEDSELEPLQRDKISRHSDNDGDAPNGNDRL